MNYIELKAFIEGLGFYPKNVRKIEIFPGTIKVYEYRLVDGEKFIVGSAADPSVQAGGYERQDETGGVDQVVGEAATKLTVIPVVYPS